MESSSAVPDVVAFHDAAVETDDDVVRSEPMQDFGRISQILSEFPDFGEQIVSDSLVILFHTVFQAEGGCSGGDGRTHSIATICHEDAVDATLSQWRTDIEAQAHGEDIYDDRSNAIIIPVLHLFDSYGNLRENEIVFTSTWNSTWSCCSGWNSCMAEVYIDGHDLDENEWSTYELRGWYHGEFESDVGHEITRFPLDDVIITNLHDFSPYEFSEIAP